MDQQARVELDDVVRAGSQIRYLSVKYVPLIDPENVEQLRKFLDKQRKRSMKAVTSIRRGKGLIQTLDLVAHKNISRLATKANGVPPDCLERRYAAHTARELGLLLRTRLRELMDAETAFEDAYGERV